MSVVTNVIDATQLTFGLLIALSVINIILAMKSRIPLINFVVGVLGIGMTATTISTADMPFAGYIQMFTLITAILAIMMGIEELRS